MARLQYAHEIFIHFSGIQTNSRHDSPVAFLTDRDEGWTKNTQIHEYGHTIQCLLLGPLYWFVVAIPSAFWCNCLKNYRIKNNVSYYKLYCESWANKWGQKWSKRKQYGLK